MQKKIIALAIAAAFAAPAVAMADVTTYGTMDGGLRHQTNDAAATGTTDSLRMGQYNSARWGFKSVEDMGDGMKTNVILETSLAPAGVGSNADINSSNSGTTTALNPFGLLFDRQATIGVETGAVKFDMGWQQTISFKTLASYDPLAGKLLGVTGLTTKAMSLRSGGMQLGAKFGDVAVTAGYDMNDSAPARQPSVGTGRVLGATYASGPINVGAAYSTQEASVGSDNPATHVTAGAGFSFGDGKVSVGYAKKATKATGADITVSDMWLGASYNMSSKIGVTAAYYSTVNNAGGTGTLDSTRKAMVVAATYALSKKTQLYFEMDRVTSVAAVAAAPETIAIGTAVGISTAF